MNYDLLQVDKENDYVQYCDSVHKYWTKDNKQPCISVTQIIHRYQTFDEDFWSSYKTLERMISEEQFKTIKPELLKVKIFTPSYYERFNINADEFTTVKTEILKEWQTKREESCIRGSNIHRQMELLNLAGETKELQELKLGGKFKPNISNKIEPGKGVYPEVLLSNLSDRINLAGQADLIIVDGYDVYLLDYKTGKTIDTKSYYDQRTKKHSMMKYPLNNLQDTNFWHYSLQLSTYAWMIEQMNPLFNIKLLMLIHIDHSNNVKNYECQYLRSDVQRMLNFYADELEHEQFKKSFEKVKWE